MSEATTEVVLKAPDISCGHCEANIRKDLGAVAGIVDVQPSAATKEVRVRFTPGAVDLDRIKAVLADSGYPATE